MSRQDKTFPPQSGPRAAYEMLCQFYDFPLILIEIRRLNSNPNVIRPLQYVPTTPALRIVARLNSNTPDLPMHLEAWKLPLPVDLVVGFAAWTPTWKRR